MIIAIDTSELKKLRIRIEDGNKISFRSYVCYADDAFPKVEKILKQHKPKSVGVVTGPGAFSATRTGVALVNALAYGFNIPITPLTRDEFDSVAPLACGTKPPVAVIYGAPPNITTKKIK